MASAALIPPFADVLMARLDELATSLMIFGAGRTTAEQVDCIAAEAEEHGFVLTALAAKALVEQIQAPESQDGSARQVLEEDLAELRMSVKRDDVATEVYRGDIQADEPPLASAPTSFAEDIEFITDFISEAREHLSLIESQMLELERNPANREVLNCVFRTFHTIKGLAGFLEFEMIQAVSHQIETLLDLARTGRLMVSSTTVDLVLESSDYLKGEVNRIEGEVSGADRTPPYDDGPLIRKIEQAILTAGVRGSIPQLSINECAPDLFAEVPLPKVVSVNDHIEAVPYKPAETQDVGVASESTKSPDGSSVRVETAKLDQLLDMVGEMVIAQSLIRNNPALMASSDPRLLGDIAQLTRNTADVQRITMGMRMIPIGQLFNRTARLIRDLSRRAGKQIILETTGEDTEVDKTIAEELSDPLLHMVRNSIDHGIETTQERAATGKDPIARIGLKAYHRAGQIVIEISDDGRGLNREKIIAKAVDRGLIESGANLSDADAFHLIFEPGFSTAEQVTDVSGRGVGMDVVRRNVQKLRGRIETQSKLGQGTTFSLKLPLTLAIIDGLVVVVGTDRYIVPLFAVREMFRPTREMLSTVQGRTEMALVRGRLLPITRLSERLGVPGNSIEASDGFLVVTESDDKRFCLLVDDLVGKQEVVIKGLGETFKTTTGLAGCAILGDGRIGLILDMEGIYRGDTR